ncbi:MAG: hypothetical protein J6E49_04245 [Acidaminococcaceae bacterium]|nr:hypothetical protein [Acidaminococcaceae bacterium]MBQ5345848.1 hypothetical protein [Acidaminococcaceae bacterium]
MTAFREYMWELLTRPFRKDNSVVVKAYTLIIGSILDDTKESLFRLRRQWLVQTAGEKALRLLGEQRGIYRYDDEPLEIYRNRVQGAYEIYAYGGTLPGMIRSLQMLGYDPDIQERTTTWAHFTLSIPLEIMDGFTPEEYRRLRAMVWLMKSAHTLPEFVMELTSKPQEIHLYHNRQIVGEVFCPWKIWLPWKKLYRLDGCVWLNGSITLGEGWFDAVYLDGCVALDGSSLLDGCTRLYDDWRWHDNVLNRTSIETEMNSKQGLQLQMSAYVETIEE